MYTKVTFENGISKEYKDLKDITEEELLKITKVKSFDQFSLVMDYISKMVNLKRMEIYNIDTECLPEAFGKLTKLEYFTCDNCYGLERLPESIGNLGSEGPGLDTMIISGASKLSSLPESIGNLSNLKTLVVSNGWSRKADFLFPKSIGNLKKLEFLGITDIGLNSLPEEIQNLHNLKSLTIGNYKLKTLPDFIGSFSKLETLSITDSEIVSLPETIGNLSNLETLELISNKNLKSLPSSIGKLTQLTYLEVNENRLLELPNEIGNLINLNQLFLMRNRLKSLPESIGNLTKLEVLDLENNLLKSLPESIGNLTSLKNINCKSNLLTSLPDSVRNFGAKGSELENFDIAQNKFKKFPECLYEIKCLFTMTFKGSLKGNPFVKLDANAPNSLMDMCGQNDDD